MAVGLLCTEHVIHTLRLLPIGDALAVEAHSGDAAGLANLACVDAAPLDAAAGHDIVWRTLLSSGKSF